MYRPLTKRFTRAICSIIQMSSLPHYFLPRHSTVNPINRPHVMLPIHRTIEITPASRPAHGGGNVQSHCRMLRYVIVWKMSMLMPANSISSILSRKAGFSKYIGALALNSAAPLSTVSPNAPHVSGNTSCASALRGRAREVSPISRRSTYKIDPTTVANATTCMLSMSGNTLWPVRTVFAHGV